MRFWLAFMVALATLVSPMWATERTVGANQDALIEAMKMAQPGDILWLSPNAIYDGPIVIDVAIELHGQGATIDGRAQGSVVTVNAPDVILRDITVIGSGSGGEGLDAGITLAKTAHGSVVRDSRILGNLVGIDVHGARDVLVARNVIEGRQTSRMNDRGNGVYIWNAPGTRVIGNDIRWGRDGIFVNTSGDNEFSGNRFRDLRFAVHYMYAHDSVVENNISIGNHLGYAVMYSDNVIVKNNLSMGDRDHGIMMNYTNKSAISGNRIAEGGEKCLFIYNAHKNAITGNSFESCDIGIHFTAGSERNDIWGNGFVGNRTQVKYVGSKWIEWSRNGTGNFWSDNAGFDIDGNGIADAPYRPNDIMDHVLWSQPAARSLLGSPAVQLIRWSQSAFPATLPGGVIDRAPLMAPVRPEIPTWKREK